MSSKKVGSVNRLRRLRWEPWSRKAVPLTPVQINALARRLAKELSDETSWILTGDTLVVAFETFDGVEIYDCKVRRTAFFDAKKVR